MTPPTPPGTVEGFDHVALPMSDADAMPAFYRALGFPVDETPHLVVVHVGDHMINFHRTEMWTRDDFTLRAPAATPPCGDLCFRWQGSVEALQDTLDAAGAAVEEGPVPRRGARGLEATSVYTRDPDGNLLEFMIYP
jgi:catechol 2,3-dioxygenase-like lactoylglutathione lyase family enzyme